MPQTPTLPGQLVPPNSVQGSWLKGHVAQLCGLNHDRYASECLWAVIYPTPRNADLCKFSQLSRQSARELRLKGSRATGKTRLLGLRKVRWHPSVARDIDKSGNERAAGSHYRSPQRV
ncbi:hypothetical protein HETIRDRAFT_311418 [Heterobasidion irregulare TC 32-1]|uniref:Uncharacterized protein n=1 Tax=Heterobasidion irregulare (strain TC 32-1) TaxID=747525 RepID=W4KJT9_HETIT|nr:uncharacterized protein HETIRDRAFT_311418 [Heterobasidion irregulare TC 32-1]ETW85969.1 hypothetical protein HETIRDRAFT_311418 [Heterobasidion irregulare TC 32-1]